MRKLFSFLILSLMVTVTVLGAQNNQTANDAPEGKVLDSTNLPMAAHDREGLQRAQTAPEGGNRGLQGRRHGQ